MKMNMDDQQTKPDQPIELVAELQRTINNQAANARRHGIVIVDSTLVERTINLLKYTTLKTFSTLHDYLKPDETLTLIEFAILEALLAAGGDAVPYAELIHRSGIVAGPSDDSHRSLWVHVCRLRAKLRSNHHIGTMRLRGYALISK